MPYKLPEDLSHYLKQQMPPTHKMWWIRGLVLGYQVIERQTYATDPHSGATPRDVMLSVGDLDAVGDGYSVRMEGSQHDLAEGDVVSLLGHEAIDATKITVPRLLIEHNADVFQPVFPGTTDLSLLEYKHWLAAQERVETTLRTATKAAIPLLLVNPLGLLMEKTIGGRLKKAISPPQFSGAKPSTTADKFIADKFASDVLDYKYTDLTPLYEQAAQYILRWAVENPDPAKGFVVTRRGQGTQGHLVE